MLPIPLWFTALETDLLTPLLNSYVIWANLLSLSVPVSSSVKQGLL